MTAKAARKRQDRRSAVKLDQGIFPSYARLFSNNISDIAPATALVSRKNADSLTAAEQNVFKDVISKAIADGIYSRLVWIHADMTHDMHTMKHMPAGTKRFLPWHRAFLVKFEQAMRAFDPSFFVPYWRWMDTSSIPSWMTSFTPNKIVTATGRPIPVTRDPGGDPAFTALPTSQTIQDTVFSQTDYLSFTVALEGSTKPVTAHNFVHMWFHGTMSNTPTSPADPMFWMLHAEIDRLWAIWANAHPGQIPSLTGTSAVLDPWPETVMDMLDTTKVPEYPYAYDVMTI